MRLAALMGAGVVYVMTHDSIGLGEDGPTHQPVEHLAALRAIPNMRVFRPCDASAAVKSTMADRSLGEGDGAARRLYQQRIEVRTKTGTGGRLHYFPQHCLYFFPLPQGQGSLRPTLGPDARAWAWKVHWPPG